MTTIVWDGETLAVDKLAKDKVIKIKQPEKDTGWKLAEDKIVGFGYIGNNKLADLFIELMSGLYTGEPTFVKHIDLLAKLNGKQRPASNTIMEALVITANNQAHHVLYVVEPEKVTLSITPGVGRTAIGNRAVIAIGCLSIGADAVKALGKCKQTDSHHEDYVVAIVFNKD